MHHLEAPVVIVAAAQTTQQTTTKVAVAVDRATTKEVEVVVPRDKAAVQEV